MAATTSVYNAVMKDKLAPAIAKQLFDGRIMLERLPKNSDYLVGRKFVVPLHYGRNEGIGASGETGSPPTAQYQRYIDAEFTPKYNWGTVALSQVLMELTRNNDGSWVRALTNETKGMVTDLAVDMNRQCYGDGTGLLETCGTTSASTTVQLASTAAMKHLRVNMVVDILVKATGATGSGGTNLTISAIDKTNKTITVSSAVTTDSTYGVYRASAYGLEITGLAGVISDSTTYGGIDPTDPGMEFWAATVLHNNGTNRALTQVLMQTAFDGPFEAMGEEPNLIITSVGCRRAYFDLLASMKRFTNTLEFEGGFKAVDFDGRPLVVDPAAPNNTFWFINDNELEFAQAGPPGWMDDDGNLLKYDGNKGYKATYYWFSEMVTSKRGAHSVLKDITEK